MAAQRQYTYEYLMHVPMILVHQTNQPTPTTIPSHTNPQAGTMSDEGEYQRRLTPDLGVGNKRPRQEDTP